MPAQHLCARPVSAKRTAPLWSHRSQAPRARGPAASPRLTVSPGRHCSQVARDDARQVRQGRHLLVCANTPPPRAHTLCTHTHTTRAPSSPKPLFPVRNLRFAHGEEDLSTPDKPIRVPSWVLKQVEENEIKIIVDAAEGADVAEDPKSGALGTPLATPCSSPKERCSSSRCSQSQCRRSAAPRRAKLSSAARRCPTPRSSPPSWGRCTTFPTAGPLFASPLLKSGAHGDLPAARRELFPSSAPIEGMSFPQYRGPPKAAAASLPTTTAPPLPAMWDEPGRAEVEPARRELSSSGCGASLDLPWAWDGSKLFANPNLPIGGLCPDPLATPPSNARHHLEPPPAPAKYLANCLDLQLQHAQQQNQQQYQQHYQQHYQQKYQQNYQQNYQHDGEIYKAQPRRMQICRLVASAF